MLKINYSEEARDLAAEWLKLPKELHTPSGYGKRLSGKGSKRKTRKSKSRKSRRKSKKSRRKSKRKSRRKSRSRKSRRKSKRKSERKSKRTKRSKSRKSKRKSKHASKIRKHIVANLGSKRVKLTYIPGIGRYRDANGKGYKMGSSKKGTFITYYGKRYYI